MALNPSQPYNPPFQELPRNTFTSPRSSRTRTFLAISILNISDTSLTGTVVARFRYLDLTQAISVDINTEEALTRTTEHETRNKKVRNFWKRVFCCLE